MSASYALNKANKNTFTKLLDVFKHFFLVSLQKWILQKPLSSSNGYVF